MEKTINALSNNFKAFELDKNEVKIDEMIENEEDVLIVSGNGNAVTFDGKSIKFIMSCLFVEEKIKETKLKLIWI